VRKNDNLTTILCRCHETWEPSGPLQACNGTALPLFSTRGKQQLLEKFCSENAEGIYVPRSERRDNIKMDVTEIGWEDLKWFYVAYGVAQERNAVYTVVSVRVSYNVTNFMTV